MNDNRHDADVELARRPDDAAGGRAVEIDGEDNIAEQRPEPPDLMGELATAIDDAGWYLDTCEEAADARYCLWDGQDIDGRKHAENVGKEPFPWEGASDTRIRLVEEIIRERVLVRMAAWTRASLQAVPVESGDAERAARVSGILRYMLNMRLAENLSKEIPLLANWVSTYGSAVLAVDWVREVGRRDEEISIEMLGEIAAAAAGGGDAETAARIGDLLQAILDPEREAAAVSLLSELYPDVEVPVLADAVVAMRTAAPATIPRPYVARNEPRWTALRTMKDVYFRAEVGDIRSAPWIARRELLTPAMFRARGATEGWDEAVAEGAVKAGLGVTVLDSRVPQRTRDRRGIHDLTEDARGQVEVWHFYRKVTDERGNTEVWRTVYATHDKKQPLLDGPCGYDHGEYPFVAFTDEQCERAIVESRGVAEMLATNQAEVKTHRDYRADRTSIAIMPPVRVPANRGKIALAFGPKSQIPERRPGEIGWMDPPPPDADAARIGDEARQDAWRLFGCFACGQPDLIALHQQELATAWLGGLRRACVLMLQLMQQFMPEEEFARIAGPSGMTFAGGADDIRGQWDILLDFSAQDLSSALVEQKLKTINALIVPLDTMGTLDRAKLTAWAMRAVDPRLADAVVLPDDVAANREIEDEQVQFTKIAAGVEPPMKEGGQNHALRLQTLEAIVDANPQLQRRYAEDEVFRKLLDNRRKHLAFQIEQQQNAQIGRLGAGQVLGGGEA